MKRSKIEEIIEEQQHPQIDIIRTTLLYQGKEGLLFRQYEQGLIEDVMEKWNWRQHHLGVRREWIQYYAKKRGDNLTYLTRENLRYHLEQLVHYDILRKSEKNPPRYYLNPEILKQIPKLMKKAEKINKIREQK